MARTIFESAFDAGGVTTTGVYEEDGQIITTETMPGNVVQDILDTVHWRREHAPPHPKGSAFKYAGSIPNTLYYKWRKEWRETARKDGMPFKVFIGVKMNSPEFKYLRACKV